MTKQESVIKYIEDNYLQFRRLRHDIVSDKLQIRMESDLTTLPHTTQPLHHPTPCYWREMTKNDINSIVCHCAQECDVNITSREVMTALQSDLIPNVHPLREYILSLPAWKPESGDWIDFVAQQVRVKSNDNKLSGNYNDNTDNLRGNQLRAALKENTPCRSRDVLISPDGSNDRFAYDSSGNNRSNECEIRTLSKLSSNNNSSFTSNNNHSLSSPNNPADRLWRACFKKWFVAMVASWMRDEVVNQQVLVLIGRQGIYKTTWLEHLIPPHLRAYTCKLSNSNDLNKDERMRIAEFGLISLDEIDSMNNRELNQLKSIITATDVNERAAYAYTKERRVRLASFCASGNRRDFLTDITGNRRWLPFEVESIQNPFFTTLPYNLMYAQAWALAQDPQFCYWFELDEIEVLEQHNQHFRDESNEEQLLDVYFAVPPTDATNAKFLTTAEISERLIYYGNIKKPMTLSRLGVLLSQKGFLSIRKGTPQRRGWIVYERDSEEINAERRMLSKN